MFTDTDKAYMAGLLEGDGYICIHRYKKHLAAHTRFSYNFRCSLSMKEKLPVDVFAKMSSNSVARQGKDGRWFYHIYGARALTFLLALQPYMATRYDTVQSMLKLKKYKEDFGRTSWKLARPYSLKQVKTLNDLYYSSKARCKRFLKDVSRDAKIAYMAGFFEADGSIRLVFNTNKQTLDRRFSLLVGHPKIGSLKVFKDVLGMGGMQRRVVAKGLDLLYYGLCGDNARRAVETISPYLKGRRKNKADMFRETTRIREKRDRKIFLVDRKYSAIEARKRRKVIKQEAKNSLKRLLGCASLSVV